MANRVNPRPSRERPERYIKRLETCRKWSSSCATPELKPLLYQLVALISRQMHNRRVVIFIIDDEGSAPV
jgi:hypothetical protein